MGAQDHLVRRDTTLALSFETARPVTQFQRVHRPVLDLPISGQHVYRFEVVLQFLAVRSRVADHAASYAPRHAVRPLLACQALARR